MRNCLLILSLLTLLVLGGQSAFAQETGIIPFKKAVPFVLPTENGEISFANDFTGEDSWLFLFYDSRSQYSVLLRNSINSTLFQQLPKNVHIFFGSYSKTRADADLLGIHQIVDPVIDGMSPSSKAYWESRVHYITETVTDLEGWVGDVLRNKGYVGFNIDRMGRLRENGLLRNITVQNSNPEYSWVSREVLHYEYEMERQEYLDSVEPLEITVINADSTKGNRFSGDIMLPDASELEQYDKLEIELTLGCRDNTDDNCFEWDYLVYLYLCDDEDPTNCKQEIGRWITSYHRIGRWVTDYTPFLPLLKDGGLKNFRFQAQDKWITTATLRFINTGASERPMEVHRMMADSLYGRSLLFNTAYNDYFPPYTFTVPEWATKTEIAAIITGHGFGDDYENCAEFCNHQHWFDVNGNLTYKKEHPEAGTQFGCMFKVDEGVTPNQFGTWPYGRGGWCPGLDVPPFRADITESLVPGENTITYRGLFNGQPFDPVRLPEGDRSNFRGQLRTALYLVHYGAKPVNVDRPAPAQPGFFSLHQNYPNPFHSGTVIEYEVRKSGPVTLTVYDAMGREVRTLVDSDMERGTYKYRFEAVGMNPGVYWYTLHGNGFTDSKRMVIQ